MRRTPLGRRDDELADAAEAAAVADAIGYQASPGDHTDGERNRSWNRDLADPRTGRDLRLAVDAILEGRTPSTRQAPSIGCNIKWKTGNAPDYF